MIGKLQKEMHVDNWNNINLELIGLLRQNVARSDQTVQGFFLARTAACDPYKYEYQAMQHKKVKNQAAVA